MFLKKSLNIFVFLKCNPSNCKYENVKYLEVIDGVQAVDGRHTAELESEEQRAVVGPRVAHVLPHQHKLGPDISTDSITNNS